VLMESDMVREEEQARLCGELLETQGDATCMRCGARFGEPHKFCR